ncbi:MAG: hypothetical protein ACKO96_45860, partial [Flammeovirgaceae bacterium]
NRSLLHGLYTSLSILNNACNPFVKLDLSRRVNQRMRPYNFFRNFIIWAKSFLWNVIHLRKTIKASKEVINSINRGKQLFNKLNHGYNK